LKDNYYATRKISIDPEYVCHVAYRLPFVNETIDLNFYDITT
jgi:hypothetical protein